MNLLLAVAVVHGGEGRLDLIYFLSALLIVALPLGVFSVLAYLITKGYFQKMREKGDGRST
jgi:hypothetical protein